MLTHIDEFRDGEARWYGSVIDDVVKPIIRDQYALLEKMGSQILDDAIDLKYFEEQSKRINEIKKHVADALSVRREPGPRPEDSEAYKMGQQAANSMTADLDAWMTSRFKPVFENYLGVLRGCIQKCFGRDDVRRLRWRE